MNIFQRYFKGDRVIWITVLLLSIISILAVYSSIADLAYTKAGGHTGKMIFEHVFYLVFSLFLMYIIHNVKYTYFSRIAQILMYITIPLLLITLIFGRSVNNASRWINILGFSFQTSELAKFVIILFLARCLAINKNKINDLKKSLIPMFTYLSIVVIFIFPANLSTALLIFGTSLVLIYIGRVKIKYILSFVGLAIVCMFILFMALKIFGGNENNRSGVWSNRVTSYFNGSEEDNYQRMQSKMAIANGNVFGKMPGNSSQKIVLPQVDCDFIYSLIAEEYGIFGATIVLILYLIILYRGVRNAMKCPGTFGAFLSIGLSMTITFQALIHMGISANLFPATGLTLPLISRGGTSMIFTGLSLGIILAVSREEVETNEKEIENETES